MSDGGFRVDAKKQNKLIIEKGRELAEEHRKIMAALLDEDMKKYNGKYYPEYTLKRPSQEKLDEQLKALAQKSSKRKGGRRTKRRNNKHRDKKKRMSRRR